jgi:uncharacterized protein
MAVQLIRQGGERPTIRKYGGGTFVVAGVKVAGSVLVLPGGPRAWPVASFVDLTPDVFSPLAEIAGQIDVCLLGCGAQVERVPKNLRDHFRAVGLHVEAMDTGAACRTFNVLAAEGRALAAALIAV